MANRRKFLLNCSAAAVGTTLLPGKLFAASSRFRTIATAAITLETFAQLVHTDFEVRDADGKGGTLELIEVEEWIPQSQNPTAEDAENEKFSLLFRGLVTEELGQKIYWFEHAMLGRFELFISQVGRKGPLISQYEAIFNRPMVRKLPGTAVPFRTVRMPARFKKDN